MTTSLVGGGIGITPPAVTSAEAPRQGSRQAVRGTSSFRGRWVAVPAAIGAIAHIWVLVAHPHGIALGALMIAMAIWCGLCAIEAWRTPNDRGFRMLIGMSIAMALIHVALVIGDQGGTGGHSHHGPVSPTDLAVSGADALVGSSMVAAMLGIAALELVIAFCAAVAIRMRARATTSGADSMSEGKS